MRVAAALLTCSLAFGCAHESNNKEQLVDWRQRHPAAAQELCAWAMQHPRASDQLLLWASNWPERVQELFHWAQAHPGFGWEQLVAQRPDWADFAQLASQHPRAVNQMLDWARRHPAAANDLAAHPGAEHFAGKRNAC
jgi:hypothetical protein